MGVFLKIVIAGIIAAALAGGVIYYGMPLQSQNTPATGASDNIVDRAIKPLNDFMDARRKSRQTQPAVQPPHIPAANSDEIKYFRLENGEFTEVRNIPKTVETQDTINPDASLRILAVMEQADRIRQSDLRDRAYLDVVDFSLREGLFTPAGKAMELIGQVELRDTARSRIAIAYAQTGDTDNAFKFIDDVEVDELRDIMRLQVIETLMRPEPSSNL